VRAVDGVDLQVRRGEVVALIGESGSGKSVTLRSLLRLHPPKRTRMDGQVRVAGQDVLAMGTRALAAYRGKVAAMVFQEPLLALDPVYSLGEQITESIRRHEPVSRARRMRGRCSCSSACASPAPSGGWPRTRTRCRAACASAP
jgi:peptide/nickel transport system ATP-binding protein